MITELDMSVVNLDKIKINLEIEKGEIGWGRNSVLNQQKSEIETYIVKFKNKA